MRRALALTGILLALPGTGLAQSADSTGTPARPFVPGGYDDKPYIEGFFGRIRVGGYVEANGAWAREEGTTSDLGFQLTRWNLLATTRLGARVSVFSELEVEHGGEEITLELAQMDYRLSSAFNLRGGMLLLPLGRFNLAHDAPRNDLPSRPLAPEELLGVALSQPGLGGFGRFERAAGRLIWELYAVSGYRELLLTESPDGTRLPAGRRNPEDTNASPAVVGRIEWSPGASRSIGASGYRGAYNIFRLDGLDVDQRRDVSVAVLDAEWGVGPVRFSGEAAHVEVEIPASLAGIFASRQGGLYAQLSAPLPFPMPPGAALGAALRADVVDFDRDLAGDSIRSLTAGIHLRPVPEAAIRLAYVRGETRDRFDNRAAFARVELGLATYF
jgi:hypothetical protein